MPHEHEHTLDPRAFLNGQSNLWVSTSDNPKAPLMSGQITVPVRFIDFLRDYSQLPILHGEEHFKFSIAYWEAFRSEQKYKYRKQPQYNGVVTPHFKSLGELADEYKKAYLIIKPHTPDRFKDNDKQ